MKPCEYHSPRERPSQPPFHRYLMSFVAVFEPDAVAIPDPKTRRTSCSPASL